MSFTVSPVAYSTIAPAAAKRAKPTAKPANQDHENMLKSGTLAAYVGGGWDAAAGAAEKECGRAAEGISHNWQEFLWKIALHFLSKHVYCYRKGSKKLSFIEKKSKVGIK